jgi:hypothetical protein
MTRQDSADPGCSAQALVCPLLACAAIRVLTRLSDLGSLKLLRAEVVQRHVETGSIVVNTNVYQYASLGLLQVAKRPPWSASSLRLWFQLSTTALALLCQEERLAVHGALFEKRFPFNIVRKRPSTAFPSRIGIVYF